MTGTNLYEKWHFQATGLVPTGVIPASTLETRKQDGRQRLYDAASKLFSHGGYEEVSVAQILEESGLKAPSLYHHYQDKEGLFVAWANGALDRIGLRLSRLEASTDAPRVLLMQTVEALVEGPDMDILQLLRDLRALKKPGSHDTLVRNLNFSVYRPVAGLLRKALDLDEASASLKSRLLVHSAMNLHPAYRSANEGITASVIVDCVARQQPG